jgi:hypothetical protein
LPATLLADSGKRKANPMEGATMTNFTKNLMAAAAALVVSAGMVSAQTVIMKADVPFAFQVNGKVMPAGTYYVANHSKTSVPVFSLQNYQGQSAMTAPPVPQDAAKAWRADQQPRLAFECGDSGCALSQVWTGGAAPAYKLSRPKTMGLNTHIAVVVMRPDKGD